MSTIPQSGECDKLETFLKANYTDATGFTASFGNKLASVGVQDVPVSALSTRGVSTDCDKWKKHWTEVIAEKLAEHASAWGPVLGVLWALCGCGVCYWYCCVEVVDEQSAKTTCPAWLACCWRDDDDLEPPPERGTASKLHTLSSPRPPGAPPPAQPPWRGGTGTGDI